jgi:pSer/pThr/pTyr-binding forkhead associated (FHA) protein
MPAAAPTLLLIVEDGSIQGQRVPLTGRVTVGRHASSNLVLPDLEVSRGHAIIERDANGDVTITDQGSANGTYVNGSRVTRHVLRPGDRLTLGQTHLRVIENA